MFQESANARCAADTERWYESKPQGALARRTAMQLTLPEY